MADRFRDRPYPGDRGNDRSAARRTQLPPADWSQTGSGAAPPRPSTPRDHFDTPAEDPLMELARLIGQAAPEAPRRSLSRAPISQPAPASGVGEPEGARPSWLAAASRYASEEDDVGQARVPRLGDRYPDERAAPSEPEWRAAADFSDHDQPVTRARPVPQPSGRDRYDDLFYASQDDGSQSDPRFADGPSFMAQAQSGSRDEEFLQNARAAQAPLRRSPQGYGPYDDLGRDYAQPYDEAQGYGDSDSYARTERYRTRIDDASLYEEPVYETGNDDLDAGRRRTRRIAFALIAFAVFGTAAAFALRSYVGAVRTGEPPVIRADNAPVKVTPSTTSESKPFQDRLMPGSERVVPREEQPVDIRDFARQQSRDEPRVVLPPTNQAQPSASRATAPLAPGQAGGDEPRRIRTVPIRSEPETARAAPASPPVATAAVRPVPTASPSPTSATGSGPLQIAPPAATATARAGRLPAVAATEPTVSPPASATGGGYVVQVSSQRSEQDARASYRVLQSKFSTVLGSRAPLIKRVDLGEKGTYYRAVIGPLAQDDAGRLCNDLKAAGGQCVIQRN